MKLADLFLDELAREAVVTRKALEHVPDGLYDWKPHEKSMTLGYLTTMIAGMPTWLVLTLNQDELDINPPGGPKHKPKELRTSRELVETFDAGVAQAREALSHTTEAHLMTPWKMLSGGKLIGEQPRFVALRDGVFNHMAHHRGQLTVYLRLNNAPVPAIYGPSADERTYSLPAAPATLVGAR